MSATATKEDLKREILKELKERESPMSFWDILLSLSRYAYPLGRFFKELETREKTEDPLEVSYQEDDVQETFKAILELFREGKCQLALTPLMQVGSFDRTRTSTYELALTKVA